MDRNLDATQKLIKSLPAEFVRTNHYNHGVGGAKNIEQRVAGFFYDNRMLNHSVASAFFIIDLCEKLYELEAISSPLYVAFQLAAEISMIHDMTGDGNWMHLYSKDNDKSESHHFIDTELEQQIPLSMFFILSDELAVWNREEMKSKHCGNEVVQQKIKTGNSSESVKIKLSYSPKQIVIDASEEETQRSLKKAIGGLKFLCDSSERKKKILGFELKML